MFNRLTLLNKCVNLKILEIMKKLILFFALTLGLMSFTESYAIAKSNVINESLGLDETVTLRRMTCFTVELSVGFLSVSAEICCWRHTTRSPKYKCDFASNLERNGNQQVQVEGFVDIESLDRKVIDYIEENKLTKLEVTQDKPLVINGINYEVNNGTYDILKDNDGRYLKLNLTLSK